jgi:hypothetical protein
MDLFDTYAPEELLVINVQFLGLKQKAWKFTRGMRTVREYHYPNDTIAIKDIYSYDLCCDDREVENVTRKLQWFDSSGVLRLEKDISPDLNVKNKKDLNRAIRRGRLDYLIGASEELKNLAAYVPEPYSTDFIKASDSVHIILKYYEKQITHYINNGELEFENAIRNESNPTMLEILSLNVRPPDTEFIAGLTIETTILHQLTGEYNP